MDRMTTLMLVLVLSQQPDPVRLWPSQREMLEKRSALKRKQEQEIPRPETRLSKSDEPAIDLRIRIDSGFYSLGGTMRADENGLFGGDQDFAGDYGLDSNTPAYAGGALWCWDRDRTHGLELSVFRLAASGSSTLSDHLIFNEVDFQPGESIRSELVFLDVRLGYLRHLATLWDRVQIRGTAGLALDYFWMTIDSSNPIGAHKPHTDEEFDTVGAFVGIMVDAQVSGSLSIHARLDAVWSTPLEDDQGSIFSGEVALEWKVSDNVSVSIGYRRWKVHFEMIGDEGGGDIADNQTTFSAGGPFFQIAYEW